MAYPWSRFTGPPMLPSSLPATQQWPLEILRTELKHRKGVGCKDCLRFAEQTGPEMWFIIQLINIKPEPRHRKVVCLFVFLN